MPEPLKGIRISPSNPDHHLWNNHGTWYLHYTVYPTPLTKQRVRRSLSTKSLTVARRRRDLFFASPPSRRGKLEIAWRDVAA
jgi:hypothetical protein